MSFTHFVGIDVSKNTLDVSLCQKETPETFYHHQFSNNVGGCKKMLTWLRQKKVNSSEAFFLMEHTGWYTLELCCFLQNASLTFALLSPLHLKRSLGLVRGKNDKVDARRLAEYAFLRRHQLIATPLPSKCLLKLKNLFTFRERLIKTQTSLKQTLQGLKETQHLIDNKFIVKQSEKQLKLIQQQVKETEAQIRATVQEDEQMQANFKLLGSIPGIGLVTAVALLLSTQNFKAFDNARKFASYCGVAPFEHRSGSSIRGRTQTSPLANQKIKALISSCASVAIQHDRELQTYYQRKCQQGKPKMVALNAVRAKLINRVFAVINRRTAFITLPLYESAA